MAYTELKRLLKEATGLDAASIGSSAVERAAQARAAAHAIDARSYLELVRISATELQALIEAVVVPETWFFRDREAFAALGRMALDHGLRSPPPETLRLLSLPCSTGEEPYSMAMALLDAGVPAEHFRIDAVDISTQALAHAERGVYGKNSFRGTELEFRERYFETTAQGQRMRDSVRLAVHFQQGNLFTTDVLSEAEIYDVVFCRNLLIYFDSATQNRAVEALRRLLRPEGVLFVGPSEAGLLLNYEFTPVKVPLAFAFRKAHATPRAAAAASTKSIERRVARPKVAATRATLRLPASSTAPRESAQPAVALESVPVSPERGLRDASSLADQGRLVEAALACEAHLRQHGPSVEAFHLLGLIRAAVGNLAEARECYRKALYLDQNHHETLLHLALLLEKQGDIASAQVLRNRLQRLEGEGVRT
jgi:chemotaxis protein methyltransferase WspC